MNKIECDYSKVFSEIYEILKYLPNDLSNKIPKYLKENIENNRDKDYKYKYDANLKVYENEMMEETKDFIAGLYLNYICDEQEKDELIDICVKNDQKKEKELRKKYNPNDLFNKNINKKRVPQNMEMIKYKENFWKKIVNKIKGIFGS